MTAQSENQDTKMTTGRNGLDDRATSNSPKATADGLPKKKGAFKITSVISRQSDMTLDGDSLDDLDESHTELTEYDSSEILDVSRMTETETGLETPSTTEDIPMNNHGTRDGKERSDMHSRFRVVKIETNEPFKRGRWTCHDFLDPQSSSVNLNAMASDTKINDENVNSGSSSAGSSVHYTPGVDDPAKNPLLAGATGTIHTQIPEGQVAGNDTFIPIHPAPHTATGPHSSIAPNPHSHVSSVGYGTGTDSLNYSQSTLCQSSSHQSISSVPSMTDNASLINVQSSIQSSNQMIPSSDSSSTGMFMPQYTGPMTGSNMSLQSVYPPDFNTSTSQMPFENSTNIQGQGQTSTFQTFVHLGHQIPNPSISQSGHSETMPAAEISANKPTSDNRNTTTSGHDGPMGTEQFSEDLNRDLNVIQDPAALSPALVAAVGDLQSPADEDKR